MLMILSDFDLLRLLTESEASSHMAKVKSLRMKDCLGPLVVRRVCPSEGREGVSGQLCGQGVGSYDVLQRSLQGKELLVVFSFLAFLLYDGQQRAGRDGTQAQPVLAQEGNILLLVGHQEQECISLSSHPCCPPAAMDILLQLRGRVELNDPLDLGEVQAPGRHVSADEDGAGGGGEAVEALSPLGLRHVSMETVDGDAEQRFQPSILLLLLLVRVALLVGDVTLVSPPLVGKDRAREEVVKELDLGDGGHKHNHLTCSRGRNRSLP
mmetsp:Transcript_45637/g.143293  ORF Transcript_45637/g.143293 Transcript_45637/m.143293 type:complete len:267 (+) Transcript_45637:238-1038(+)